MSLLVWLKMAACMCNCAVWFRVLAVADDDCGPRVTSIVGWGTGIHCIHGSIFLNVDADHRPGFTLAVFPAAVFRPLSNLSADVFRH
jgi:hypothetical protein